jgi:mRNA interferase MazF
VIQEGQVVLFAFPQTDQKTGKLRPALVLCACPGGQGDWLIRMISSQLRNEIPGIDEVIHPTDDDFGQSGLKLASVVRATRLAVVAADMLQGRIGTLSGGRVSRIRRRIADWVSGQRTVSRSEPIAEAEPEH